jgi:hypothetical protein
MGMVRPEVRLAYRRGSANVGSAQNATTSRPVGEVGLKSNGIDESNVTASPTRLTPNQEDDIANPADRTS